MLVTVSSLRIIGDNFLEVGSSDNTHTHSLNNCDLMDLDKCGCPKS